MTLAADQAAVLPPLFVCVFCEIGPFNLVSNLVSSIAFISRRKRLLYFDCILAVMWLLVSSVSYTPIPHRPRIPRIDTN